VSAIDHVVVAVRDLDAAAARLAAEHGLTALPGGRHPGAGTANRIVPLGDAYLELMAIVEPDEAATSLFGRLVAQRLERGEGVAAWCVRPDDLESAAAERGLELAAASRVRPDGVELRWRLAGVAEAIADPSRPFLIAWDVPPELHPSAAGPSQGELLRVDAKAGVAVVRTARGELRL
jgi:glyoxalase-like protein